MDIIHAYIYHTEISRWIACITFFAAFVLTLWPDTKRAYWAAASFCLGLLARLIYLAIYYFSAVTARSDGYPSEVHPTDCLVISAWVLVYAAAAVWLLYPSIPQQKALRFGKILHLVVVPPLVLWLAVGWVDHRTILSPYDLTWLLYAVLWFRIREAYIPGPNKSLQATAAAPASCD
jgi:hypothetical protein